MIEDYAKFITRSVTSVFTMMGHMETQALPRTSVRQNEVPGDVTGIIDIQGEKVQGSAAVSFSRELVFALCKKMLHYDATELDEVVQDLAKEMTNMVIGGAKSEMDNHGYYSEMSVPSLVIGKGQNLKSKAQTPGYVLPFTCAAGDFWITLCLEG